ncbi:unnamed protein product [Leptosia nina]|uniref:Uncharacterized protein n=1 Tax=Leptosia nina TaxID=320188 RepID=A0AAV1JWJ7_9NEOP
MRMTECWWYFAAVPCVRLDLKGSYKEFKDWDTASYLFGSGLKTRGTRGFCALIGPHRISFEKEGAQVRPSERPRGGARRNCGLDLGRQSSACVPRRPPHVPPPIMSLFLLLLCCQTLSRSAGDGS